MNNERFNILSPPITINTTRVIGAFQGENISQNVICRIIASPLNELYSVYFMKYISLSYIWYSLAQCQMFYHENTTRHLLLSFWKVLKFVCRSLSRNIHKQTYSICSTPRMFPGTLTSLWWLAPWHVLTYKLYQNLIWKLSHQKLVLVYWG